MIPVERNMFARARKTDPDFQRPYTKAITK